MKISCPPQPRLWVSCHRHHHPSFIPSSSSSPTSTLHHSLFNFQLSTSKLIRMNPTCSFLLCTSHPNSTSQKQQRKKSGSERKVKKTRSLRGWGCRTVQVYTLILYPLQQVTMFFASGNGRICNSTRLR